MSAVPTDITRPDYIPGSPMEAFIVPLLKREIDAALENLRAAEPGRSRVLDVGCGRQPFRLKLEESGYGYSSMDMIQNADNTVDFVGPIDGSLPDELLSRAPFELIFCTEVLEHVPDWDAAFANFAKLLRPTGKVLITCPHFYFLHHEPYDFWRPTPHAFPFFAKRHGLVVRDSRTIGDAFDVLGTLLACFHTQPKDGRLWSRFVNRCYWTAHRMIHKALLDGRLRTHVSVHSSVTMYHSNVVVLEKA